MDSVDTARIVERHNEELEEIYKKAERDVLDKVVEYNNKQQNKEECATFPLLLKSYEKYENADIKIMFFGQETNSWCGIYGQDKNIKNIKDITDKYEELFIKGWLYERQWSEKNINQLEMAKLNALLLFGNV